MILRAIKAVRLLTRIRLERPDLWRQIQAFAKNEDRTAQLMKEAEEDYHDYFEGNLPRKIR